MSRADLNVTDQRQIDNKKLKKEKKHNKRKVKIKNTKRKRKKTENASQDVKGSFKCDRIKGKGFTWKQKTDEKK